MRLIDADAITYCNYDLDNYHSFRAVTDEDISDMPTIEAVSVGVLEQIRWERDMAMQQLEEHDIPFCAKADDVVKVVRCKDCEYYGEDLLTSDMFCGISTTKMPADGFCSYGERKEI